VPDGWAPLSSALAAPPTAVAARGPANFFTSGNGEILIRPH
jgi:hypothetical protein